MSSEIRIHAENDAILRKLVTADAETIRLAAQAIARRNELVVGIVKRDKLSRRGPHTLGVVTNRLRGSAAPQFPVINGHRIASSIGSNVVYAPLHEFGYRGAIKVRQHQRRQPAAFFGRSNPKAGERVTVRAHVRQVDFPARRMFGSVLDDQLPKYASDLAAVVEGSLS